MRMMVRQGERQPGGGGGVTCQRVKAASLASSMVWLTLVVRLGALGARVDPQLWKFYYGQPLVQGRLAAWHGQALACTHFTPGRCVQLWGIVRGTDPAVTAGPRVPRGPSKTASQTAFGHCLFEGCFYHFLVCF